MLTIVESTNRKAVQALLTSERIRDVATGPDGAVYLLTDSADGRILRILP